VVDDVVALAHTGPPKSSSTPNPDTPRPRDFSTEQGHLLEIKDAYEQRIA
jgi:hypothetical protein